MNSKTQQRNTQRWVSRAVWFGASLAAATSCRGDDTTAAPVHAPSGVTTPDRLAEDEALPESETAFGVPVPRGMRLTRHFLDSAYLSGSLSVEQSLDHVRSLVLASSVEMAAGGAVFHRAKIRGDEEDRLFRIEITPTRRGSQVVIRNITPPPTTPGLSEADQWRQAGRNPDGTLLNPNQVY